MVSTRSFVLAVFYSSPGFHDSVNSVFRYIAGSWTRHVFWCLFVCIALADANEAGVNTQRALVRAVYAPGSNADHCWSNFWLQLFVGYSHLLFTFDGSTWERGVRPVYTGYSQLVFTTEYTIWERCSLRGYSYLLPTTTCYFTFDYGVWERCSLQGYSCLTTASYYLHLSIACESGVRSRTTVICWLYICL